MQPCHVLGTDHLWALVSPLPGVEADGLWSNPSASGFFGGSALRFLRGLHRRHLYFLTHEAPIAIENCALAKNNSQIP
jgi:hypothetical protein